jgi:hypothetical protein
MSQEKNLVEQLLKSLRMTLVNIKIYPINSPLVEKQINDLFSILKQILQEETMLTISEVDNKIFVNDKEYIAKDPASIANLTPITQFFLQSGIKSITFKKEINIQELKTILLALSVKKPKVSTKEFINQIIKEKNIKNVAIDEVEYISITKSDQSVKSILNIISQPVSDLSELVNILGVSFNELDKIKDEKTKKSLTDAIIKYVSSLDTNLIKELFVQPLPQKIEQTGFKQLLFNNLTKQTVEEIFNEIITWCKQLKSKVENETEYIEQLQNLKEFIKLVVNSPVSKLVPIEIFEELFKIGLIDALPEWILEQKEEKKSWIAQLDELLSTNEPTKLLQEKFISNLQENIEKLCLIGLDDKLEKLVFLMIENFSNPVVKIRQLASSATENIAKQFVKFQKGKLAKNLVSNILKFLIKEQDETVVKLQIQTLEHSLCCLIITDDYESFVEYAQQLLRFAEELTKVNSEKSKLIYSLFDKVYQQTKDYILLDLTEPNNNINKIVWFLTYIAEQSIATILSAILQTTSQQIVNTLVQVLVSLKNQHQVIESIEELLVPQTPVHKLSKILDILPKFDYDFSNSLRKLYNYTNYANKVAILNYIQEKPTEENLTWLTSLLQTEEPQILQYLIDILTSLGHKPAAEKIMKLFKIKDIDVKKRVCISLGMLKHLDAIKKLKKIIKSKKEPIDVRIAACWALGNFSTLPEVKSYLQSVSKKIKEPSILNVIQEVLNR